MRQAPWITNPPPPPGGGGFEMAPPSNSTRDLSPDQFNDPRYAGSTPGMRNMFAAMFGGNANQGQFGDWSGVGGLFGGDDPLAPTRGAFDTLMQNGGIVEAPGELAKARYRANVAYDRDEPGAIGFNDFFGIGNGNGPAASILDRAMGPNSSFGWRGPDGSPIDVGASSEMRDWQQAWSNLNANPDLGVDAAERAGDQTIDRMAGQSTLDGQRGTANDLVNATAANSTIGNTAATANSLAEAVGAGSTAGTAAGIGNDLSGAVGGLNNSYEDGLLRAIDTEAGRTLSIQSPELQAQMQMAGLGRSGGSDWQQGQLFRDVLNQANRDKQRTLAGFSETGRGLQAQALGQAAQGVFGAVESDAGRQAQALGQGAQGIMGAQQADAGRYNQALGQGAGIVSGGREADASRMGQAIMGGQGLQGQALGLENQRYLADMQNFGQQQLGLGGLRNQALGQEGQMQGQGMDQLMGMFGLMRGDQQQNLDTMMRLALQQRQYEQDAMNAQIQAGMLPFQTMLTVGTGTTSGGFQRPAQATDPWTNALAGAGGNVLGNVLGGGVSPYQGTYTG